MSEQAYGGNISPDDGMKSVLVMAHTQTQLAWGEIQINQNLRVNLVLSGTTVPDFISLHNAKVVAVDRGLGGEPAAYSEMHIPTNTILAFHLMPPHSEPLDFDPNEPNRKMEPVTAQLGNFVFHGHARISTQTNIKSFLEVTRAEFVSLYHLQIVHRFGGGQSPIQVDAAQLRRLSAVWTSPA